MFPVSFVYKVDAVPAVLGGEVIALSAYIRKEELRVS